MSKKSKQTFEVGQRVRMTAENIYDIPAGTETVVVENPLMDGRHTWVADPRNPPKFPSGLCVGSNDIEAIEGGWIGWAGGECPVPAGTKLDVRHRDGEEFFGEIAGAGSASDWSHDGGFNDIVAYRIDEPDSERIADGMTADAAALMPDSPHAGFAEAAANPEPSDDHVFSDADPGYGSGSEASNAEERAFFDALVLAAIHNGTFERVGVRAFLDGAKQIIEARRAL